MSLFNDPAAALANFAAAIPKAIEQGRLSELIELSLTVAFQNAANVLWQALQRIAAGLPDLITAALAAGHAGIPTLPLVGARIAEQLAPAGSGFRKDARFVGDVLASDVQKNIADAVAKAAAGTTKSLSINTTPLFGGEAGARLQALRTLLGVNQGPAIKGGGPVGDLENFLGKSTRTKAQEMETTALEKIGFIISRGPGADYPRETAANTREMVRGIMEVARLLRVKGHADFLANAFENQP
jgi:hypothetical protein